MFPLNALSISLRVPIIISGFVLKFIPLLSLGLLIIKIASINNLTNKILHFSLIMVWILT
jgi:hypothetical protein